MSTDLVTIRTVGGLLPPDLLARVLSGDSDLGGLRSTDYHLASGETPREAANRAWSYLSGVWTGYRAALGKLPEGDPAVGLTRDKWLLVLLRELGYGRVPVTGAGGIEIDGRSFPVSHLWERTPMHLLGWGVELDKRTKGVPGAAERAPHAMLQELLNRSDPYLWGMVSNGRILRLLRDSTSLSGQAFVEFDLEAMFDGEVFSDFVLLYLLAHQSRVEVAEDAPASDCWLERWRTSAVESGTRALGLLRDGVKDALEALGTGFLRANPDLNERIATGELRIDDYHRSLLRTVYRLLFLFVAEDRGALLSPDADTVARQRYAAFFSTSRLRRLSIRRRGTRHEDLWAGLSVVIDALGQEDGRPELGLVGIGGLFDHGPQDVVTDLALPNEALLSAVRKLTVVQPRGQVRRTVDYRNLGAEELGSIYESLLELVPRHQHVERTFTLEDLAGNDRKTSGSYYTPSSLIDLVLDEALDPLLDEAEKSPDPAAALLAMTVCDPACGSGHFLVAAARRIGLRLATARTGEIDPTPTDLQEALHDVIARCIYGVDLNPMAADLAKVSLWLEAMSPGRPLSFLDAHIKVGNALLGTTPGLLARGIPDTAYDPIEGDDKKHAAALKKRNRLERDQLAQGDLFGTSILGVSNAHLTRQYAEVSAAAEGALTLADVHFASVRFRELEDSPEASESRRLADRWSAAFVQHKTPGAPAITQDTFAVTSTAIDSVVEQLATQYRFFHWHLEFPDVFLVPGADSVGDTVTGWRGGFTVVVGNPPWETVQMSEKEFFASRAPEIANAATAAKRKGLIEQLRASNPELHRAFLARSRMGQGENLFVRASGRYPLTARGKISTDAIFAEHFRSVVESQGRMGIITPTGLATGATTAPFFADTLRTKRLVAFYDFENEAKIFAGVHHAYRFAVTCITGGSEIEAARLGFLLRAVSDVGSRRFVLSSDEVLLLNPNTGNLPVFRTRHDAEITLSIYRRYPVLVREQVSGGNRWNLRFSQGLFNMASDSHQFRTASELEDAGYVADGWAWGRGHEVLVPLYEAKLIGHYDHRFSTYQGATQAQLNMQTLPRPTDAEHDDPTMEVLPRYWVSEAAVDTALAEWPHGWLLGWRDITSAVVYRTFVPSVLPVSAVADGLLLAFPDDYRHVPLLQAIWSSLCFDYVSRQKLSGTHMKYFAVRQLASPGPDEFEAVLPWIAADLRQWLLERVLELSFTSHRMSAFARDFGDHSAPFRWDARRRADIQAEIDALMFHLFGLERAEVSYVLDSFTVMSRHEQRDLGEFRTRRLVLERYDQMALAAASGGHYESPISPPPGQGPRHEVGVESEMRRP